MKHYREYEYVEGNHFFHYFRYGSYDCFYLRLWSWTFAQDFLHTRHCWHRLYLTWHGRDGFAFRWWPEERT